MVSSSIPWVVRVFGFIEEQLQSKMTSYDQFFYILCRIFSEYGYDTHFVSLNE